MYTKLVKQLVHISRALETRLGGRVFKLIRYLISGGTAAAVNWSVLFLLVHIGSVYYLYASVIAFIISIGVSFAMQKFWTFRDNVVHDIRTQFSRYLFVIFLSLVLNTTLVYLFVEKLHIWYLLAQIIATLIIAITNFFCYKHFVFRDRTLHKNSVTVS